ncbi:MAG: VWA domain-containing protein [Chitinophagales bacterium]
MLKLAHIEHLWALALLGFLILLFAVYWISRMRNLQKIGNIELVKKLNSNASISRKIIKFSLYSIAFVSLVIAWANPLIGTKYEKVKREGIDVIFAIDVSKSMNAQDIAPSRLLKAKQIVSNLIEKMSDDRIGLIVFAGNAYLQMPITVDYSGAKMYLKTINTEMVPKQGTAIGQAVNLAMKSFDEESEGYKTLVIISDGEDHDSDAIASIEEAVRQGITVHSIGVGSEQGAPIPENASGEFKKDQEGNIILSKMNEDMLKELAQEGKGSYFNASNGNLSEDLLLAFSGQEGRMIDEKVFTSYKNHFPLFLGIAFVLLFLEFNISESKSNIFGK